MSETLFHIASHIIPACHIRGYSRGIQDEQKGHLRLAVKQYTPKNRIAQPGDITLVLAHGIGSSKESYEPFFDDLLNQTLPIRGIWAADVTHHGQSYLLNQEMIGDEPHWLDPARDMLYMVNHFQELMPPPIYGVGLSWGCVNILMMSTFHPRLFAGMILIEPTFETGRNLQTHGQTAPRPAHENRMAMLSRRRDVWQSREHAKAAFLKSPYYRAFDPRVFEKVLKYDLRDRPTPDAPHAVMLTTPKAQEVYSFGRTDPPFPGYPADPGHKTRREDTIIMPGFYRGEVTKITRVLPDVLPPTLYLWGSLSDVGNSDSPERVVAQTGVGEEGNGGTATGKVISKYVAGAGHPVPLEKPEEAAKVIAEWLGEETKTWREEETRRRQHQPPFDPAFLNPLWLERMAKL